jgi:hypothetical protein
MNSKWNAKYILDEDHNVVEAELMEWARFFEDFSNRLVRKSEVRGKIVSTVFLGIDHSFTEYGPPLVFETMVFPGTGSYLEEDVRRYATWDEAVTGHTEMCAMVAVSTPFWWPAWARAVRFTNKVFRRKRWP